MNVAFVDAGALVGLVNRSDEWHDAVREALGSFRGRLLTSTYVFDEAVTRCLYHAHHAVAVALGRRLLSGELADLRRIDAADERAAWELFERRPDERYSFTDCTSFVLMRRLGIETAYSVDGDFDQEGFVTLPSPKRRRRK